MKPQRALRYAALVAALSPAHLENDLRGILRPRSKVCFRFCTASPACAHHRYLGCLGCQSRDPRLSVGGDNLESCINPKLSGSNDSAWPRTLGCVSWDASTGEGGAS